MQWIHRFVRRPLIGSGAILLLSGFFVAGSVHADPADDALAKLNELSRQAEQTTEQMYTAQLDLDRKVAAQKAAEDRHAADLAALDHARGQLSSYQASVNKLAAAMYMGGRTDGFSAIMTADSPQGLIDKLSVQRDLATQIAAQTTNYRRLGQQATQAEVLSAQSSAEARTAAQQAAAVRADVQAKQSELQVQIAVVKSQYLALSPNQRIVLGDPGPVAAVPAALPGPPAAMPGPPAAMPGVPPMPGGMVPPGGPMPGGAVLGGNGAVVVQAALSRIGSPYSWGGSGPNAFDCSGLVMWAFQQDGKSLPHSSQALAAGGQPVSMSDMQPGDVVTYYGDASHAAIYVGNGMMVHSSTYGTPVGVAPVDNAPIFNVRRY